MIIEKLKIFEESKLGNLYRKIINLLEGKASDILMLFIRIWMARVFWISGLTKISSFENTIMLFQYEYKVPIIAPVAAAFLSTLFELACPVLITLGIMSRLASIPLIMMTLVIQFTYLNHIQHLYWILLLLCILCFGAGKISVDYFIRTNVDKPKE